MLVVGRVGGRCGAGCGAGGGSGCPGAGSRCRPAQAKSPSIICIGTTARDGMDSGFGARIFYCYYYYYYYYYY